MRVSSPVFQTVVLFTNLSVGILFRLLNLTPYKLYPDSYQNLLVAQNIYEHISVVAPLGEKGMLYPPFFMWSRPLYPLLISFTHLFRSDWTHAAYIASFLAGVVAIVVVYFFIKHLFRSVIAGIGAAFLLSISFNHVVWGGFILTETTGVLLMLFVLWTLLPTIKARSQLAELHDLLTGTLLACAILARYEYIILLIPISLLIFSLSPAPVTKLLNIGVSLVFVLSLVFTQLFPVQSTITAMTQQVNSFLWLGGLILLIFVCLAFIFKFLSEVKRIRFINIFNTAGVVLLWIIGIYLLLQTLFPTAFRVFFNDFDAMRNFFTTDFLLGMAFIMGITIMHKNGKFRHHIMFILLSIILLAVFYYHINPTIQRYWTHTIPFLLIPASYIVLPYAKHLTLNAKRQRLIGFLILLIGIQGAQTYQGIKNWKNGEFTRTSYEEKAAHSVSSLIKDKNILLLVSFPEPYYYVSRLTTHSIADEYPYIFIDNSLNNRTALIVQDMGMRDIFPRFSDVLDNYMQNFKQIEFRVREIYHYGLRSENETHPVSLYEVRLSELRSIIETTKKQIPDTSKSLPDQ